MLNHSNNLNSSLSNSANENSENSNNGLSGALNSNNNQSGMNNSHNSNNNNNDGNNSSSQNSGKKRTLRDPYAHRRVEKTRRDRMNLSLNKLSSLIPESFRKQGAARVDKIKTLDIAIAYVEHLQSIMRKLNIDEKTSLPSPSSNIIADPTTIPTTTTNPTSSSESIKSTNQASNVQKTSQSTNTPPHFDENLWYIRGLFNGSMELISYLIEYTQSDINDAEEMSNGIEFLIEVFRQFHHIYFRNNKLNENDIQFVTNSHKTKRFPLNNKKLLKKVTLALTNKIPLSSHFLRSICKIVHKKAKSRRSLSSSDSNSDSDSDSSDSRVINGKRCGSSGAAAGCGSDKFFMHPRDVFSRQMEESVGVNQEYFKEHSSTANNQANLRQGFQRIEDLENVSLSNSQSHFSANSNKAPLNKQKADSENLTTPYNADSHRCSTSTSQNPIFSNSSKRFYSQTQNDSAALNSKANEADPKNRAKKVKNDFIQRFHKSTSFRVDTAGLDKKQHQSNEVIEIIEETCDEGANTATTTGNKNEVNLAAQSNLDLLDRFTDSGICSEIGNNENNMLSVFILHSSHDFYVSACLDETLVETSLLKNILKNCDFKPKTIQKIKLDVVFSSNIIIRNRTFGSQPPSSPNYQDFDFNSDDFSPSSYYFGGGVGGGGGGGGSGVSCSNTNNHRVTTFTTNGHYSTTTSPTTTTTTTNHSSQNQSKQLQQNKNLFRYNSNNGEKNRFIYSKLKNSDLNDSNQQQQQLENYLKAINK